CLQGYSPPLTF
nr:immunoglobulin light chain junction region [Macaca mulatta]